MKSKDVSINLLDCDVSFVTRKAESGGPGECNSFLLLDVQSYCAEPNQKDSFETLLLKKHGQVGQSTHDFTKDPRSNPQKDPLCPPLKNSQTSYRQKHLGLPQKPTQNVQVVPFKDPQTEKKKEPLSNIASSKRLVEPERKQASTRSSVTPSLKKTDKVERPKESRSRMLSYSHFESMDSRSSNQRQLTPKQTLNESEISRRFEAEKAKIIQTKKAEIARQLNRKMMELFAMLDACEGEAKTSFDKEKDSATKLIGKVLKKLQ